MVAVMHLVPRPINMKLLLQLPMGLLYERDMILPDGTMIREQRVVCSGEEISCLQII